MRILTSYVCGVFLGRDTMKKGQPEQKVRLLVLSVSKAVYSWHC